MITDGNVRASGQVSFVSLDRSSTAFVRDFIAPSSPIREERTRIGNVAYRWLIWSKPLVELLSKWEIVPRKSLVARLPILPSEFMPDLIRGVLDGDGSVDGAARASFSTASRNFANDLIDLFVQWGLNPKCLTKRRSLSVYLGIGDSWRLHNSMYRPGAPCLERKRIRFRTPAAGYKSV